MQKQKFTFHLYAQPVINTVVYDATLQGGMILNRKSPYTLSHKEIEHFTFQGNAGMIFTVGSFYAECFQSMLSEEFSSIHKYRLGGLRIGVIF